MSAAGHRLLPHTSDCIIEAWGPDRIACLTEVIYGLLDEFSERSDRPSSRTLPLAVGPGSDEDVLVSLLEEVIYVLDVFSVLPVRVHLGETEDGGLRGDMDVVPLEEARITGPVPKAVSYNGLSIAQLDGSWRCQVLVDL